MDSLFAFLENFYTAVYIADMETHKLVFMNKKAREMYHVSDGADYQGKPCYTFLQGLSSPCPFCTNPILKSGNRYEWDYYNPVVDTSFHLIDNIFLFQGHTYRIEMAIPESLRDAKPSSVHALETDQFINRCLMSVFSTSDSNQSISLLLQFLCTELHCSCCSIYELHDEVLHNTYCWPENRENYILPFRTDITPALSEWYSRLVHAGILIITNGPAIRSNQHITELLHLENLDRLILATVCSHGKVAAVLRLDDPDESYLAQIPDILRVLSYLIIPLFERRNLLEHLEIMSYHDQMTGAFNRHALDKYTHTPTHVPQTVGFIYCDIVGLKLINDELGHENGDQLIIRAYHLLSDLFPVETIYRVGGDEFLVICENMTQEMFEQQVVTLRSKADQASCRMSVGSSWSDTAPFDYSNLIKKADDQMYADKSRFYQEPSNPDRDTNWADPSSAHMHPNNEPSAFGEFISRYHFDIDIFLRSISMPGTPLYFFYGDMLDNVFFISENLRDEFGFPSNLVYNFIPLLEQRIYKPDRQMHVDDTHSMFEEKRTAHSIRYRIYNKDGELIWIHCRGILKWNENQTQALFFAGTMSSLKNESEVDPVTGLLNVSCAHKELLDLCTRVDKLLLITFSLLHFSDINLTFGRYTGDTILREIGNRIELEMGENFRLYRLDGLRFLAVSHDVSSAAEATHTIRQIILDVYWRHGIRIMYPCAIGVLYYPQAGSSPQELLDNASILSTAAKKSPSREYIEFSSSDISTAFREQSDLRLALNYSISRDYSGFRIVIQPQVESSTGRIHGGEVLLRWDNDGDPVSPAKFIPVLEQFGLIVPVGNWVVNQTMQACQRILLYAPDFKLSFNVSYLQIMNTDFFDYIQTAMQQYAVPGRNIAIELTETHLDQMPSFLERFIQKCKQKQIDFVLDDFGSAYSSLHLLLQYPASLVKLDRTLMHELTSSTSNQKFMESIIYACHLFGKKVCVEGVETGEELAIVRRSGCDYIQGFYFHRPMELDDLYRLLRDSDCLRPR